MRADERTFPVMGTIAHVVGVSAPAGWLDAVVARLDEVEARWSRFLPTSDVCRANSAAGEAVTVAPETVALVATALEWSAATDGLFQPAVLDALVAAGYDRSFERLDVTGDCTRNPSTSSLAAATVDRAAGTITVCPGAPIDLGGIGKGAAADLVARELGDDVAGGCVNLGGDLRAWGAPPDGADAWHIAVEVPGYTDLTIGMEAGAVATSSTVHRRWQTAGGEAHHVIDPRTRRPAQTDLVSVTVVDTSATTAEVLAKVALVSGADGAPGALHGAPALLCTREGAVLAVNGMEGYLT